MASTADDLHRDVSAVFFAVAADLEKPYKDNAVLLEKSTDDKSKNKIEAQQKKLEEQQKKLNELQAQFSSDLGAVSADLATPERAMDFKLDWWTKLVKATSNASKASLGDPLTTGLHLAVRDGRAKTVEALLTAGADIWLKDKDGNVAMDYSCSEEVRAVLAEHLANVVITAENKNKLFGLCVQKNVVSSFPALLQAGFDPTNPEYLIDAALNGHKEMVKTLLDNKANVAGQYPPGGMGMCLHFAARKQGNTDVVRMLVEAGADVTCTVEQYGRTPARVANDQNNPEVEALLEEFAKNLKKKEAAAEEAKKKGNLLSCCFVKPRSSDAAADRA